MGNRRNATRAQRIWREIRKLSAGDIMQRYTILNARGETMFFWRPDELEVHVIGISTRRSRPMIYAHFCPKQAATS